VKQRELETLVGRELPSEQADRNRCLDHVQLLASAFAHERRRRVDGSVGQGLDVHAVIDLDALNGQLLLYLLTLGYDLA
jgi:hypothetical protein